MGNSPTSSHENWSSQSAYTEDEISDPLSQLPPIAMILPPIIVTAAHVVGNVRIALKQDTLSVGFCELLHFKMLLAVLQLLSMLLLMFTG